MAMTETPRVLARVVAPLVNTNEREARVVELNAVAYSRVSRGDVICVLETSKATAEVEADHDGWLGEIHIRLLDDVPAGDPICEIYESEPPRAVATAPAGGSGGHRLTRRAAAIAEQAGVDLTSLPTDRFLTEQDVRTLIARTAERVELDPSVREQIVPGAVVVFGGGGLGKCLIECLRWMDAYSPLCVVDDGIAPGGRVIEVPVVGGRAALGSLVEAGARLAVNGIGAIGRMQRRIDVFDLLEDAGFDLPVTIDRGAVVAASAHLHDGVQVHPGAVIASAARIGRGSIVNTGAIVSHDCDVGAHCHLAPGATLAGEVTVGEATLVGMEVTVALGLTIGARAIVGNGAVLNADVPDGAIVAAGSVWNG